MPIALTKKPKFAVVLALWFVFSLFVFLSYRAINRAHEWIITPLALKTEFTFPDSWFAELEVRRRIRNGSLRNSEFLSYVLSLSTVSGIDSEKAFELADQLLEGGLDIDTHDISSTPLHTAIYVNNSNAVKFLLSRCADPFALTKLGGATISQQKNAFELLDWVQEIEPAVDRSDIAHMIENWKPISDCDGR